MMQGLITRPDILPHGASVNRQFRFLVRNAGFNQNLDRLSLIETTVPKQHIALSRPPCCANSVSNSLEMVCLFFIVNIEL